MTDPSQPSSTGASSRSGVSTPLLIVLLALVATLAGGIVWWLQEARVEAREAARAEAAAQLEKTLGLLKASEATAAAAAEQLKQAKGAVDAATKQAADATAQLDTVRRDASTARSERDQAKAALASAKSDLDRMRASDADPGLLAEVPLGKVFGAIRQVRASTALQMKGQATGLDPAALDAALGSSLAQAGLTVGNQSPFKVRLLATVGPERPRHSVGLLMLVMRTFKIPGEAGSRDVAIWGQQRTSHATDEEALPQVQSMVADLCRELGAAMGAAPVPATAPAPAPNPASPAPAAPAPNGPKS